MFKIETLSNKVVKGAALVIVQSFIIVDAAGNLVSGTKAYDTEAEAQAKIDGLGNLSEGLAFAQAQYPELSDKAQVGKANVIAVYLDWVAAGKPVKSVEELVAADTSVEAEGSEPAEPAAPVADEEETF